MADLATTASPTPNFPPPSGGGKKLLEVGKGPQQPGGHEVELSELFFKTGQYIPVESIPLQTAKEVRLKGKGFKIYDRVGFALTQDGSSFDLAWKNLTESDSILSFQIPDLKERISDGGTVWLKLLSNEFPAANITIGPYAVFNVKEEEDDKNKTNQGKSNVVLEEPAKVAPEPSVLGSVNSGLAAAAGSVGAAVASGGISSAVAKTKSATSTQAVNTIDETLDYDEETNTEVQGSVEQNISSTSEISTGAQTISQGGTVSGSAEVTQGATVQAGQTTTTSGTVSGSTQVFGGGTAQATQTIASSSTASQPSAIQGSAGGVTAQTQTTVSGIANAPAQGGGEVSKPVGGIGASVQAVGTQSGSTPASTASAGLSQKGTAQASSEVGAQANINSQTVGQPQSTSGANLAAQPLESQAGSGVQAEPANPAAPLPAANRQPESTGPRQQQPQSGLTGGGNIDGINKAKTPAPSAPPTIKGSAGSSGAKPSVPSKAGQEILQRLAAKEKKPDIGNKLNLPQAPKADKVGAGKNEPKINRNNEAGLTGQKNGDADKEEEEAGEGGPLSTKSTDEKEGGIQPPLGQMPQQDEQGSNEAEDGSKKPGTEKNLNEEQTQDKESSAEEEPEAEPNVVPAASAGTPGSDASLATKAVDAALESPLGKEVVGEAVSKLWWWGFGFSSATFFTGLDFMAGAVIMDIYWWRHRKQPKLFPMKGWQKVVTVLANLLPPILIVFFLGLVMVVGCNFPVSKSTYLPTYRGSYIGAVIGDECKYFDISNFQSTLTTAPSAPKQTSP